MPSNPLSEDLPPLLCRDELQSALDIIREAPVNVRQTPLLLVADTVTDGGATHLAMQDVLPSDCPPVRLHLKMENCQLSGAFKIRGVLNQITRKMRDAEREGNTDPHFVCLSAGNFGRSFAMACGQLGVKGTVLMMDFVPESRAEVIRKLDCEVEWWPSESIFDGIAQHESKFGSLHCHQDDRLVAAGHASMGVEIIEQLPEVDIVLLGCGSGGLAAGLIAAFREFHDRGVKVYTVEPERADGMKRSLKAGRVVDRPDSNSVALGLSAPFTGTVAYAHIAKFGAGHFIVSEEQILAATKTYYDHGFVVEPAGAAALAVIMDGQLARAEQSDLAGKNVVIVCTGGNVAPEVLEAHFAKLETKS